LIWIDFGILCLGQKRRSLPPDMQALRFECRRRTAASAPLYCDRYHFHTADQLLGCWYQVWLPESICYEESFFDISARGIPFVEVVPKWAAQVEKILRFYISESPVHRIAVLLRVQDRSDDRVHPDCSLDEFMQSLTEGRVRWNELYYLHL